VFSLPILRHDEYLPRDVALLCWLRRSGIRLMAINYSTKQARKDAVRRTRLRRELRAQVSNIVNTLTAETIAAINKISAEEWQAAQEQDDAA